MCIMQLHLITHQCYLISSVIYLRHRWILQGGFLVAGPASQHPALSFPCCLVQYPECSTEAVKLPAASLKAATQLHLQGSRCLSLVAATSQQVAFANDSWHVWGLW